MDATSDKGSDAEERGTGPSAGWRALVALANGAAVVVTEEMPVSPEAQWLKVGPGALNEPKRDCFPDWVSEIA